ncbi:ABC transporter ATP-binding protein [Novipirellula artificiosorum]|uniref:Trehalose import ATP-binding protein SugC n=1 Tax=Novipirellula artificiosorum TaxID=2528016 RepID=A0A5C6DJJ4_9BACT|nr:ABC transporter ATP-binding protein [Novipirellula artificiosorum]TWU35079.1 Trehalose import ATP-binding protein SugC [Novipirellula artificiosorum]
MPAIYLDHVSKSFHGKAVLRDLNLEVRDGEYLVLLGESGSGKTTTLRAIAGLEPINGGRVRFGHVDVTDLPARKRNVSMVFQHDGLYPHLSIRDNLSIARNRKIDSRELQSRIEQAATILEIKPLLDRLPSQLSGGELRRAAMAKSIVRQADVRLLDEPLSALDATVRHQFQHDLLRCHHSQPASTIHVTHDGNEAMRMADRIAVIDQGEIVQVDTPHNIYHHPCCVSVAKSIGSPPINLLDASLKDNQVKLSDLDCSASRTESWPNDCSGDFVVGIRPEAFRVRDTSSKTPIPVGGLRFSARCCWVAEFSGVMHLEFETNGKRITVLTSPEISVRPGELQDIEVPWQNVHWFPKNA